MQIYFSKHLIKLQLTRKHCITVNLKPFLFLGTHKIILTVNDILYLKKYSVIITKWLFQECCGRPESIN